MSVFRKFDLSLIPSTDEQVGVAQVAQTAQEDRSCATFATCAGGVCADADIHRAHLAVIPDLTNPEDIQVWIEERAATREDSGIARVDADKLAFDELLWIWHAANPVEHAPGQCAACGTAFEPPAMSLPDGALVCDKPDHGCLIAYGSGRRMEAVKALGDMGITPPAWWELAAEPGVVVHGGRP